MEAEQKVGAVQLSARLRGVSPPVIRQLLITEQSSLAELHAALQVSFGWSDQHLYSESAPNRVLAPRRCTAIDARRGGGVTRCWRTRIVD